MHLASTNEDVHRDFPYRIAWFLPGHPTPGGTVAGKPTLSGSQWDVGVEVRLEHCKTHPGLLARFFSEGGQNRFDVLPCSRAFT